MARARFKVTKKLFRITEVKKKIKQHFAAQYKTRILKFTRRVIWNTPVRTGLLVSNWNLVYRGSPGITYQASPLLQEGVNYNRIIDADIARSHSFHKVTNQAKFGLVKVEFSNRTRYAKIVESNHGMLGLGRTWWYSGAHNKLL